MEDIGLFGLMDDIVAEGLEVTIEEYTEVIDKCSYWEGLFIISVFLGNHIDKFERAREVFDSHRIKEYADS